MFNEIRQRKIGISKFASIGNMADINHADVIRYLADDPDTRVIALFVESIKDGVEFMEVTCEVSKAKPIVAFKAGRTEAGKRAAKSHTGAMTGEIEVYEAAFKQSGVILTKETEEFFDVVMALSSWAQCLPKNKNVGIMTISGGPCVTASDLCEEIGLSVPKLKDSTREEIRKYIPFFGADSNPVDMPPQMSPANYERCVNTVFAQEEIGGIIAINVGLDQPEFANAFVKANKKYSKPVVSFTIDTPKLSKVFHENNIPIYPTPERSVYAYNGLVKYSKYLRKKPRTGESLIGAIHELSLLNQLQQKVITGHQAMEILKEYKIPVCREAVVKSIEEALECAKEIDYPVVAKIHSVGARSTMPLHKSAIGGKRDPNFGPTILIGMGGIFTEVFKDVSLRVCPINRDEAREMIQEIKGYSVLTGYRGKPGCDIEMVVEVLLKVSDLLMNNPQIKELDINPLIVGARCGVPLLAAVDALIVL